MRSRSPGLWVVATPLGNPGDFSPRARAILAGADLILAEDTRRAQRLLREQEITPIRMLSYFEHNEQDRLPAVLKELQQGKSVAIISDAGTPLLADPGYRLVQACRHAGIAVRPVPGPSAPVAALSASGLPPIPHTFLGFLPRDKGPRVKLFKTWRNVPTTLIFFERKDRLAESLRIAETELGDRDVAICREITKEYEEFINGRLADLAYENLELAGELTVIIGPPETADRLDAEEVLEILREHLRGGAKPRQAARLAQNECPGWDSRELYALLVQLKADANS